MLGGPALRRPAVDPRFGDHRELLVEDFVIGEDLITLSKPRPKPSAGDAKAGMKKDHLGRGLVDADKCARPPQIGRSKDAV